MGEVSKSAVIDSNILIYHINGQMDLVAEAALSDCFCIPAYISTITAIEVLSWPGHTEESAALTAELLDAFEEISIDQEVKSVAISIRRAYKLKIPDAIIAATALHLGIPLITRNVKDFRNIPDLELINPFENVT